MSSLVLGPMLRYVDGGRACVWVETSAPATVAVDGGPGGDVLGEASTFTVHGHHYALVTVEGLRPGTRVAYGVTVDGTRVWPARGEAGEDPSPSLLRPFDGSRSFTLAFGSCRTTAPHDAQHNKVHGVDVLRAFARRMRTQDPNEWPDALLLLGDQVYADEPSVEMRDLIAARRSLDEPPGAELADFVEYTALYRLAWRDPDIRWLLSTLPSMMIFDDHDIRDDWNTSAAWREQMDGLSWWRPRIVGGLGAYWVYQHLGNLSPEERAAEGLYDRLVEASAEGGDAGDLLDEFADRADREPTKNRWSYARDVGRSRIVVIDSRCGRVLDGDARAIVDADEWAWVDEQLRGDLDHLVIGTSLPYLLPLGIHHVEGWNEAVSEGRWGRRLARRTGEAIRQAIDLEHWAGFRRSFDALTAALTEVVTGRRGTVEGTVVVLSGDVHYSYLATARLGGVSAARARVYQAVCSPIRNPLRRSIRYANGVASFWLARIVGRALARAAGVTDPDIRWSPERGPWFDNALATLRLDGPRAVVRWETAREDEAGKPVVVPLGGAIL